jgi:metal-responsive CopG/Arc/MetJ family transcriptional regulator
VTKVLVSLDASLLHRIDRAAKARGLSRSAYLAQLANRDLDAAGAQGLRAEVRAALRQLDDLFAGAPAGDAVSELRELREERI